MPQDDYLREVSPAYNMAKMVDLYVPKDERVFGLTSIAQSYSSHEVLVDYESAFNNLLSDMLNSGWVASAQPRVLEKFKFPEQSASRIRLTLTSTGQPLELWSVHELRFFYHGSELPRDAKWRLSAWPNPWDAQLAFDSSPVTRWRTWERPVPGDYLQVDFDGDRQIDEVRVERSWDQNPLAVVQTFNAQSGKWANLAKNPTASTVKPDPNIRRYASRELALRGIHYVLMLDTFPGAFDFRADPEGWGLREVAAGYGVRLYQVVQP